MVRNLLSFLREGERRAAPRFLRPIVSAGSVALTLFILWLGSFGAFDPYFYGSIYLSFILALTFILVSSRRGAPARMTVSDAILSLASIAAGVFLYANFHRIQGWISGLTPVRPEDAVIGLIVVFLVIEATRRTVGPGLLGVVLLLLGYIAFGNYIPGQFGHSSITLDRFIEQAVYSTNAIFGPPVQIAASYAFLFVLFGQLYHKAGGGEFFFQLAAAFAGRKPGGPAKVAVVASGLFGTVSGSPTSDVLTTGSVTIPLMKRLGYDSVFAGAVESVASAGGSIMPPVMGSAAFLMAEFTGIRYVEIAKSAFLVGLLYYLGVYFQVHMHSRRARLPPLPISEVVGLGKALVHGWPYLIPLGLIIGTLLKGYTPTYAAVAAVTSTIVISWFLPGRALGPRQLLETCENVCSAVVPLTAAVAAGGLVLGGILMTGFAGKFGALIFTLSHGDVFGSLVISMLLSILLGMGMPTPSVYIMTASLLAPSLLQLHLAVLPSHLFLIYFAALSAITPPVAVAAFAASSIANANPMRIATYAVRLGITAFIVPFLFVYHPQLLLLGHPLDIVMSLATAAIGVYFVAFALEGWMVRESSIPIRCCAAVAGLALMIPDPTTDLLGLVVGTAVIAWQLRRRVVPATLSD